MENGERVVIPLYLVYGTRGQRLAVGEVTIDKEDDEFTGTVVFGKSSGIEAAMDSARSLTNKN